MPDDKPISDNEAHQRLFAAQEALGDAPGLTVIADTALKAARKALSLLKHSLVEAMVRAEKN